MQTFITTILTINVLCGSVTVFKEIRHGKGMAWVVHLLFELIWLAGLLGHLGVLA